LPLIDHSCRRVEERNAAKILLLTFYYINLFRLGQTSPAICNSPRLRSADPKLSFVVLCMQFSRPSQLVGQSHLLLDRIGACSFISRRRSATNCCIRTDADISQSETRPCRGSRWLDNGSGLLLTTHLQVPIKCI